MALNLGGATSAWQNKIDSMEVGHFYADFSYCSRVHRLSCSARVVHNWVAS